MERDNTFNLQMTRKRSLVAARNTDMPTSGPVREVEIMLLRAIASQPLGVIADAENVFCGGGILVAYDVHGRKFKIEITQVDGPE